ncbi:MAG: iron-sulfur cluster assembly accessory protein [Deltaproteobacteria bacterium CG11_big_fil_rev_8_21_14_0_20_47_16]|nr:MAG: iron-sulfur cluster assembly accessory protein [Deltaproteobacteria bacterium CG11_big_fil_rev_8_21_14_0_20_47_16]
MVTLTENAVKKVKDYFNADTTLSGKTLRIFIEAGGCSGYQYGFTFDEKREGDQEFDNHGIKVLVDAASIPVLNGCVIDYVEDFNGAGFSVKNPNAKKSCGCGSSFDA